MDSFVTAKTEQRLNGRGLRDNKVTQNSLVEAPYKFKDSLTEAIFK